MKLRNKVTPKQFWVKLLILTMVITVMFATSPIKPAQAATSSTWSYKNILSSTYYPDATSIAVDSNGYLYTAVTLHNSINTDIEYLYIYRSTNNGGTWSYWKQAYTSTSYSLDNPVIEVDLSNNDIYVSYEMHYHTSPYYSYIRVARLTQSGSIYNYNVASTSSPYYMYRPTIAVQWRYNPNYIFVAFEYYTSGTYGIRVYRSTNHGVTWTVWEDDIFGAGYDRMYPDLAIDARYNTLYLTYRIYYESSGTYAIYTISGYCTSSDATVKKYSLVFSAGSTYQFGYPTIAISRSTSASKIAVAVGRYYEGGTGYWDVLLRYANAPASMGAPAWSSYVYIDSYSSRNTRQPKLAVDGMETTGSYSGNFWIVYHEYNEGGTSYSAYVVKKASYSNLASWSEYQKSTSIYASANYPRTFGLTTFTKGGGGYGVAMSFRRSNYYIYTAGDFVTMGYPSITAPASGSTTGDTTPTLSWSSVGASSYRMIMRKGSTSGTTIRDITTTSTSYTPSLSSYGSDDYWWYVIAYDSGGTAKSSSWSYFWLDMTPPGIPVLTSPTSGTSTNDNTPIISWSAPSTATQYQVYYYRPSYSGTYHTLTSTSYTLPALPDGHWYWCVRAADVYNNWGTFSAYNNFYVDTVAPGPPSLVTGAGGVGDGQTTADSTPKLDWSSVSGAYRYWLQVDDQSDFSSPPLSGYLYTDYYTTPGLSDGTWYWHVATEDLAGNIGSYSAGPWSFTIDTTTLALQSPEDGTFVNDTTPTYDWNDQTSATAYRLEVSTDSTFTIASVIDDNTITTSTATPTTALTDGVTYYWRVRALVGSWLTPTDPWNFTVDVSPPGIPTLDLPLDDSYATVQTVDLDWTAPSGTPTLYRVQVDDTSTSMSSVIHDYTTTATTYPITFSDGEYFWRVRARDAGYNWGTWSAVWNFTVDTIEPGKPSLVSPTDGEFVGASPLLEWTEASDATEYQVQVDDEITFSAPFNVDTTSPTNSTTVTPGQGTYYWRVRAKDIAGNYGQWSSNISFTVDTTAPSQPLLISPSSGTVITDSTPWLNWTAVSDAVLYQLQVDNDSSLTFLTPEVNITTTSNVSWTLSDDTYYWRVRAQDAAGNWGSYSGVYIFTIDATGPTAPSLTTPVDGSTLVDNTPELIWGLVSDADTYRLQVDTSLAFNTGVDINITSASHTTSTLADGTYYWRVSANDSADNWGEWSDVWSFVVDTTGAAAPNLASPNDGALLADNTPQLDWGIVGGATAYRVLVDDSSMFSSPEIDVTVTTTSHTTTTLAEGTYYWRVQAKDAAGNWGDWSTRWNFTIDTVAPAAPTLSAPTDDASLGDRTPLLEWNAVSDGLEYNVQVSDTTTFTSLAYDVTTAGIFFDVPDLLGDGTYYWRVRTKDEAGNWGSWSTVWNFIIDATPPSTPTLSSPADSAPVDYTPQLNWIAPTDATQYQLQLATSKTFTTILVDTLRSSTWYLYPASLGDGTYYWQVRAADVADNWSPWSANRSFTIDTSAIIGPSPPSYISPSEGEETANGNPTIQWVAVTTAANYNLQIGNSTHGFISPVNVTSATNHTVVTTLIPGEYQWRVRSADAAGNWGSWGLIWKFSVPIPPPVAPMLVAPTEDSTTADTTPTLDWNSVSYAEKYQVQISASPSFTIVLQNENTTSTDYTSTLLSSSDYYWRVRGINVNEEWGTWSAIWKFTVSVSVPVAPTLVGPVNEASTDDTTPRFTWNTVTHAANYNVQIDDNDAFTSPDPVGTVTTNFYTSTVLAPGTYYWRVRAANSEGTWGPWSTVWSFTIEVEAEPTTTEETTTQSESTTSTPGVGGPGFEFIGIIGLLLLSVVTIRKRRKR